MTWLVVVRRDHVIHKRWGWLKKYKKNVNNRISIALKQNETKSEEH